MTSKTKEKQNRDAIKRLQYATVRKKKKFFILFSFYFSRQEAEVSDTLHFRAYGERIK